MKKGKRSIAFLMAVVFVMSVFSQDVSAAELSIEPEGGTYGSQSMQEESILEENGGSFIETDEEIPGIVAESDTDLAYIPEDTDNGASIQEDNVSGTSICEDTVSGASISEDTATEDAVGSYEEYADGKCLELNGILDERCIMAVLYLKDSHPLRSSPCEDSEAVFYADTGTTLYLKKVTYNEGKFRFLVNIYTEDGEKEGYVTGDSFVCVDEEYLKWEESLKKADETGNNAADGKCPDSDDDAARLGASGLSYKAIMSVYSFPDSYRDKLFKILESHPEWIFVPQKVGITLDEAVSAELSDKERNLVYSTVDESFKGAKKSGNWYYITRTGLKYYMNPSNFVGSEQNIFMFEQLTYNSSYHTLDGVQSVLSGTFMKGNVPGEGMKYSEAFFRAGSELKVSPYHLAARVYQEQGKGTSPLISGTYPGYEGYYNYFNISASGKTNDEIYRNGLSYARDRGWNTRYKSIYGGSQFDSKNYILAGQDTAYLEKYNVVKKVYWHQYMQNASAPLTEASKVYSMYKNSGSLNNPFVFKIPVYEGDTISPAPTVAPILGSTCCKINIWRLKGRRLMITEQSDDPIRSITLKYNDAPSDLFRVYKSGSNWEIGLTDEGRSRAVSSKKQIKQKLTMHIVTDRLYLDKTFTVTTDSTKPDITAKLLKKSDLYHVQGTDEATAQYRITSSSGIVSVGNNASYINRMLSSGKPYYSLADYDKTTGILTVKPCGLNASNAGKMQDKIVLDVNIEGYLTFTYAFRVSHVNKKPSVKVTDAVLYGTLDNAMSTLTLNNAPDDLSVSCTDERVNVKLNAQKNRIGITVSEGFKTGKKKLVLTSNSWRTPVNITLNIKRVKSPAVKLSTTSVKLNSALDCDTYGTKDVSLSVKGSSLEAVIDGFKGANASSARLIDSGYLRVGITDNVISLGLVPVNRDGIKAGTYRYTVTGHAILPGGGESAPQNIGLSVTVIDKRPSAQYTLKTEGTINTVNRDGTYVVCTPKITDLNADVLKSVELTGEGRELFEASLYKYGSRLPDMSTVKTKAGVIVIRAKGGAVLETNRKYELKIRSALSNGLSIDKTVTVKPVNKPAKTKGSMENITVSLKSSPFGYTISSAGANASDSVIKKVELAASSDASFFSFSPDEGAGDSRSYQGLVRIRPEDARTGKYRLKFRVTYKGQAANAAPSTVILNVTVKP